MAERRLLKGPKEFRILALIAPRNRRRKRKAPDPTDTHVGSRVRMRRNALEMTQQQLGDALGLTFQQVQKYEQGTNRIGAGRLQHIANILQVPVEFFFEGVATAPDAAAPDLNAPSPAYLNEFLASSDGLRLTKAFTQIDSSKLRRAIVGLVQEIVAGNNS
jgi:transcriptional regulator with XRE-family HTH domain